MNYITSLEQIDGFLDDLNTCNTIALDIESTKLDPFTGTLLLVQMKLNDNIYIFDTRKLDEREITYIIELINRDSIVVIAQNAVFDVKFLKQKTGIMLENVYCTQVAEAIITGGKDRFSSLNDLIEKYYPEEDTIDKDIRDLFIDLPDDKPITQEMLLYSAKDVNYLQGIYEAQINKIKEENMLNILNLETKLIPVIASMELNGVLLDSDSWLELYEESKRKKIEYEKRIKNKFLKIVKLNHEDFVITKYKADEIYSRIKDKTDKYKTLDNKYEDMIEGQIIEIDNAYLLYEYFMIPVHSLGDIKKLREISLDGIEFIEDLFIEEFNIDSPVQLKRALNISGIQVDSTAEDTLKKAKSDEYTNDFQKELIDDILNFKEYSKRVSSFGKGMLEYINPVTGRIHASVHQIGTRTGRTSYSEPNLQQVPHDEEFRKCFVAPDGKALITSDYSQQELRLAGDMSEDEVIIDAYEHDKDIHSITASVIYNVPLSDVDPDQRYNGKTLNFQTIYGATKWGIARNMEISVEEAEKFLNLYFSQYKRLGIFKKLVEEKVWDELYSTTPLGRKRFFDWDEQEIVEKTQKGDHYAREKAISSIKREGFNHPIQGGSADMLKKALNYIYYENPFDKDKFKMLMIIHDEIVVEVDKDIAEEAKKFIVKMMNKAGNEMMRHIKAKTESNIGKYWSK